MVPSHCGIAENKKADNEAKAAFQEPIADISIAKGCYKEEHQCNNIINTDDGDKQYITLINYGSLKQAKKKMSQREARQEKNHTKKTQNRIRSTNSQTYV